ncbi:MAG: RIP metalloprotease RseP [Candidatus Omnitrophota bacterium]
MLSAVSFIGVLSVLVIVHEFGHFIVAKRLGICVEKFSIGFGPEVIGITKNGTRYIISLIPLGGYVKLKGENEAEGLKGERSEYLSRTVGERARVIFAGPLLNYVLAFLVFSFVFMAGSPTLTSTIGKILPGYPGETSGIKEGDRILKINDIEVKYWDDVTRIIHTNKESELYLLIERGHEILNIKVSPKEEDMNTVFGTKKRVGIVGIMPNDDIVYIRYDFFRSFYMGGKKLVDLSYLTVRALWASITGKVPFKQSITGPVGIFYITGEAAKLGIVYLLQLMGVLSMSLAIFNLLPFPVLDGGHLFFLAIEKIRRKPISIKVQENVTQAGFIFLMALMLLVVYNDLIRFGIFDKIAGFWRK